MSIVAPIAGISAARAGGLRDRDGRRALDLQWLGIVVALGRRRPRIAGARRAAARWLRASASRCSRRSASAATSRRCTRRGRRLLVGVARLPHHVDVDHSRGRSDQCARRSLSPRRQVPILALIGIGDTLGNLLFARSIDERASQRHVGAGVALSDRHRRARAGGPAGARRPLARGGHRVDARRRRAHFSWSSLLQRQLGDASLDLVAELAHRLRRPDPRGPADPSRRTACPG